MEHTHSLTPPSPTDAFETEWRPLWRRIGAAAAAIGALVANFAA